MKDFFRRKDATEYTMWWWRIWILYMKNSWFVVKTQKAGTSLLQEDLNLVIIEQQE